SEELRREFDHMALLNQTPKDYGLKVRSHPEMLVTSKVKMRHGTEVDIDFSGSTAETVVFPRGTEALQHNLDIATELLSTMPSPGEVDPVRARKGRDHRWAGARAWSGVPAKSVLQFLNGYRTHKESHKVNAQQLAEFISLKNGRNELTSWDVVLLSGEVESPLCKFGDTETRLMTRAPRDRFDSDKEQENRGIYLIRRLLSPRDEAFDLTSEEYEQALRQTVASWQADAGRSKENNPPKTPSGPAIRAIRGEKHPERGLLLIYPLNPDAPKIRFDGPIVGFGISFPSGGERVVVRYTVNNVFWQTEYSGQE
ncbi:MAG: endonuclease, partial [Hyphomicrobium sp.]